MVTYWDLMEFAGIYPLVNINIQRWRIGNLNGYIYYTWLCSIIASVYQTVHTNAQCSKPWLLQFQKELCCPILYHMWERSNTRIHVRQPSKWNNRGWNDATWPPVIYLAEKTRWNVKVCLALAHSENHGTEGCLCYEAIDLGHKNHLQLVISMRLRLLSTKEAPLLAICQDVA